MSRHPRSTSVVISFLVLLCLVSCVSASPWDSNVHLDSTSIGPEPEDIYNLLATFNSDTTSGFWPSSVRSSSPELYRRLTPAFSESPVPQHAQLGIVGPARPRAQPLLHIDPALTQLSDTGSGHYVDPQHIQRHLGQQYNPGDRLRERGATSENSRRVRRERIANGYPCQYHGCTSNFSTASDRGHHERYHGERPHLCAQCSLTFSVQSDLRRHTNSVHSRAKSHTCEFCDYETSRKDALLRHVRRKHHTAVVVHQ